MSRGALFQFSYLLATNALVFGIGYTVFPDTTASFLGLQLRVFQDYDYARVVRYLGVLSSCLAVEFVALGWRDSSLRKLLAPSISAKHDLVATALSVSGLMGVCLIFFTVGTVPILPAFVRRIFGIEVIRQLDSHALQFAVWFIVVDFINYWYHRLLHTFRFGWEIHKYHHAASEFTMLTGARVHFLEKGVRRIIEAVPLAILGSPIEAYITILVVRQTIELFQHSMVNWDYGWAGRWLVFSPIGHRIHHSKMHEHFDKNFGNIFPIWDRIFGTWYSGETVNTEIGVTDNYFETRSVWGGILHVYHATARQFTVSFFSGNWRRTTIPRRKHDDDTSQLHAPNS